MYQLDANNFIMILSMAAVCLFVNYQFTVHVFVNSAASRCV